MASHSITPGTRGVSKGVAKIDLTGRRVDRFRMAASGAISTAMVRHTEMRPPLLKSLAEPLKFQREAEQAEQHRNDVEGLGHCLPERRKDIQLWKVPEEYCRK